MEYISRAGCIQYDPLDVVGRNPELVLQSRCGCYRMGDIEKFLYTDRTLFDVWDKNMSICTVGDWAYFSRFRRYYLQWCAEHRETIDEITAYLRENASACSSDFDFDERVSWHYGPQRLAKAALECMCYAGLAVVHHKKGARRYYGLADRYIPKKYFTMPDPNGTDEEYFKWAVLRRINSIGILWNRPSDAWLGIGGLKSRQRSEAFNALLDEGRIIGITVKGIKQPLFIGADNFGLLEAAAGTEAVSACARILAPLDNMLWDRNMISELFGFKYRWEVYTPAAQRKYGYYVLPVLCGNEFAGRIELEIDKKSKALIVKNFWAEEGISISAYRKKIISGLSRFAGYALCKGTDIRCKI